VLSAVGFSQYVQDNMYTSGCERCKENQVVYLSSQLTPLLWPCLFSLSSSSLSVFIAVSTSLRGSTSINNSALCCHTLLSLAVCVCAEVICLQHTQRNQTRMQAPCFVHVCRRLCKYSTFWTHRWVSLCVASWPSILLLRGRVIGVQCYDSSPQQVFLTPHPFCFCLHLVSVPERIISASLLHKHSVPQLTGMCEWYATPLWVHCRANGRHVGGRGRSWCVHLDRTGLIWRC